MNTEINQLRSIINFKQDELVKNQELLSEAFEKIDKLTEKESDL